MGATFSLHSLPDVDCIFSATNTDTARVGAIIEPVLASGDGSLVSALEDLERRILGETLAESDDAVLAHFEVAIGELITRCESATWKKFDASVGGIDGYGLLLPDDSAVIPRHMLEELLETRQPGTLSMFLVGVV